jgi:hypothetical protein
MRVKRFVLVPLVAGCLLGQSAMAQSPINTIIAVASPRNFTGSCPASIGFTGTISVNGQTKVTYRWERSDKAKAPVETVVIQGRGQSVSTKWQLSRPKGEVFKGAETLHVLTPVESLSNPAEFTLVCR